MMRILLAFALAVALGCGKGVPTDPKDYGEAEKVALLLTDLEDARSNSGRLSALFVPGTTPPDADRLQSLVPQAKGKADVSGETATALVAFTGEDGKPAGETTWTFAKVGGAWKIKEAPLP